MALKWVLPEEFRDQAQALYEEARATGTTVVVPPHFPVDVVNAIRGRVAR